MSSTNARRRVAIAAVSPEIDGGRFPAKRAVGEWVDVEADVFADGHDVIVALVRYRAQDDEVWTETPMTPVGNDRWHARFVTTTPGRWRYTVCAWIDEFATWRRDLQKRLEAGQDVTVELRVGATLVEAAMRKVRGSGSKDLKTFATRMLGAGTDAINAALDESLAAAMAPIRDAKLVTTHVRELEIVVDRERGRFSSWYEFFPRSTSPTPGAHGTLADATAHLDYVARLGFDVVYLPPVHPIGNAHRKGPNNAEDAGPDDPGSPWAIGSSDGGHDAIHPHLGSIEDFDAFVARAGELGMEVAMDLAYQCSPDHPYVTKHPEWFRHRPDGSIQYAENPPKRYQDIYPLNFGTPAWQELWDELRAVVEYWIGHGVKIFRVDNPHTKPFAFWEWLIESIKAAHPDVLFLSEAFTRPKIMQRLAKVGFTQSYSYFTWRVSAWELRAYFTELTRSECAEYMRPNLWPNTPDILPEHLRGRPAFVQRLILAATLGANYGIYGPAFELMEQTSLAPGREEYLDSEKYEIKQWDIDRPDSLASLIAAVNQARQDHPAFHTDRTLQFCDTDNEALLAYVKTSLDGSDVMLTIVNTDLHTTQSGMVRVPVGDLGMDPDVPFIVSDLLTGARYSWSGEWNYVELNPFVVPAHVFHVRQRPEEEFSA